MNYQKISDEELKQQDNGSIDVLQKTCMNDGRVSYSVSYNIFPYSPYTIAEETFEHFKQFCRPEPHRYEVDGNVVLIYTVKHWSEI